MLSTVSRQLTLFCNKVDVKGSFDLYARTAITGTRKASFYTLRMFCCYLEHSCIVIEIRDVLEQVSPDADVIQHHTHAASRSEDDACYTHRPNSRTPNGGQGWVVSTVPILCNIYF